MRGPSAKAERPEQRDNEDGTIRRVSERLLLPLAGERDAEATCEAIRPYVAPHSSQLVVVYVIETDPGSLDEEAMEARRNEANAVFDLVRNEFTDVVHPVLTDLRYGEDLVDEIRSSAAKFGATAIGATPGRDNDWIRQLPGDGRVESLSVGGCPVVVFPRSRESRDSNVDESPADSERDERRRLLVPIDGSEQSMNAVEHACSSYPGAEITVLHVLDRPSANARRNTDEPQNDRETIEQVRQRDRRRKAEQMFREARELAAQYDVELVTMTRRGTNVPRAVIDYAENHDADQIVIGSRRRSGLGRLLLGSVGEAVVRRASTPVTVVR